MSFQATIEIDGKTFNLLYYRSDISQSENSSGQPTPEIRGGSIWFIIEGSADDTFSAWMSDTSTNKDGAINLYSYDQEEQVFKKIEFSAAYVTSYFESYAMERDNGDDDKTFISTTSGDFKMIDRQMIKVQNATKINHLIGGVITAEKICIDGVNHANDWWT